MIYISIITVFVAGLLLCMYFEWNEVTYRLMLKATYASWKNYSSFDNIEDEDVIEPFRTVKRNWRAAIKRIKCLADVVENQEAVIDMPSRSNHNFAEATGGEWGKVGYSHYGKGATLHTYRTKKFTKKVLHPCMVGDCSEQFS